MRSGYNNMRVIQVFYRITTNFVHANGSTTMESNNAINEHTNGGDERERREIDWLTG